MEDDLKTPVIEPIQEPPSRPKVIRNRDVDKAASALAEDHVLPEPPGKDLSWDQMQQYLALFTPAMWSHVLVYIYRLRPKIRRQLKDPNLPNYIDCLSEPFNLDYFINRHGGGKYSLQAVDTEGKKPQATKQLFRAFVEINEIQHPPILNFEELELEARENKSYVAWLQNKGILDGKGNVIQGQQGQQQPSTPQTTFSSAKEVLDILSFANKMTTDQQNQFRAQFAPGEDSLSKSVGQILLEKMKQDDPAKQWTQIIAFMEKMSRPPDLGIAQILQMQAEQRKTDLEYTRLLLENQGRQSSTGEQFGQFREIISFARELIGTSGGGRRNGWDTGLEFARDVGLPALQTIGNAITNIMMLKNGGTPVAPMQAAAPPQGAFDPYSNPSAMRQYSTAMNAQQPQPTQPPTPPQPPPPGGPPNQLLDLFQQYGNLVVNALNNGTPGYDFADSISLLLGGATHATIAAQGEDALTTTMLTIPPIAIFGEARIRTFVHEFVHYAEYLESSPEQSGEPEEVEPDEIEMPPKVYRPPQRPAATQGAHA